MKSLCLVLCEYTSQDPFSFRFTARCYEVRSIATAKCLSVRLSMTLRVSWSHRLEFFENIFMADWLLEFEHFLQTTTSRIYF